MYLASCNDDEQFIFDKDDLIDTKWGIPHIIEKAPGIGEYDKSAPTIFYDDGTMQKGDTRWDFWRVRNSQSLHIEKMAEIWFVIELKADKLHVEKSKYPSGEFILTCIYYPMED